MTGAGTDSPRDFREFVDDTRKRIVAIERRQNGAGGGGGGGDAYQVQAGILSPFGGGAIPSGWLLADGQAVPRAAYTQLFSVIGTTYGVGNGSTTFNLPDLRGRVAVGRDGSQVEFDTLGETGGAKTHTLTVAEIPSHTHLTGVTSTGMAAPAGSASAVTTFAQTGLASAATGGSGPHNNLQPYQVTNWIISTGSGVGGGGSNVPALPDPVVKYGPDSQPMNWGGTVWGDLPGTATTFTLAQPLLVQVDFGAQITVPSSAVYGMIGVNATGALTLQPEYDQTTLAQKFGNTPFSFSSANNHIHGHKILLLPAGTTTLTMQVRRSGTSVIPNADYSRIAITPINWMDAPGPVIPMESGLVSLIPTSVVGGVLFGTKVNFSNIVSVSLNGVFSPEYDEYIVETVITSKSANGGGWFRLRANGVDDAAAGTYGMQADYNNGPSTPATSYSVADGFAFAVAAFNTMGKMTWKISGPAQGVYFKASHIATMGQNSGAILNMDIKGTKGGSTVYDGFSLVSSSGTITGYLRVYALA